MKLTRKVLSTVLMIFLLLGNFVVPVNVAVAAAAADKAIITEGVHTTSASDSDIDGYVATDITFAPGKNATELNFAWYSNLATTSSAVQIAEKAVMTGSEFPADKATTFTGTASSASSGFFSNKVTVTGLTESRDYVYRVGAGEAWSTVHNFTTQDTDSYSFLAIGDAQIGSSGSVASDTNGWKDTMSKALNQFEDVSFLLSLGDQVESNNNETEYSGFFAPQELRSLPVAPLVGNHDNGAANYNNHFNLPNLSSQYGITTSTSSDYYFTYGDTLIMVLNSNNTSGTQHEAFIHEAIDANPNATWKVAMFHHDIYGSGGHAAETGIKNLRQALFPIFDQYDVDLVLTGHDHSYTRTYQMYNDQPILGQNSIGTVYMTLNSGSGSKYYDLQAAPETYAAVREQIKVPTFSKFDVTANTLTISTYRTDTMAKTDTYTITKKAQEALDLAEVTATADGQTLTTQNPSSSIALSVTAKNSAGAAVGLNSAYVLYKTAEPDILAVATDGKVTVKNAPTMNKTVQVWAEVYDGSKFVKSNELSVNVTVPIGLAQVTLAANGTSISSDSTTGLKLSLSGKDTTGAVMALSSATVEYATDKADILAIAADGTVTVKIAPERNTNVIITADVTLDGKKVTSNALPITVTAGAGTELIVPVKNALDDIEERADGTLDFDSSDLEIVQEKPADSASQLIGIRFVDLAIPQGATVTDAYIQFSVDEVNKDINPFNVHIHAENAANSAPFIEAGQDPTTATKVVSDRYVNKIAASVEWKDAPAWTIEHEAGSAEQTPNLASLVQNIVDKTGWNSGNAISFLLSGEGRRIAESFEGSGNDSEKPTLHVNYVEVDSSITISAARALAIGQTSTVTGIVSCVNPTTTGSYFIQDNTAGICVYNTSLSPAPQLGDKIQVTGVISAYKGLLEIMPGSSAEVIIKSSGNSIPEPQVVTLATYQNFQSQRVKIRNVTLGTINVGGNTTVTDDSGSSVIYKTPALTGISAGDKVDIVAISAAYNSSQLIVPSASDITKGLLANDKTFDIVEITDFHGNLGDTSSNQIAAVLAQNIKNKVSADNPTRTLILAGGDNYQGTAISNLQYGEPVMETFNYMGVAASALGNHEFDWGLDKVTNINGSNVKATYPIVCANLFPKGNTSTPVFDPYKIFTLDGVKIAVVGGITELTPGIVAAGYIEDYDVLSNVTYINKYAEQARSDGAQIVIALIHEGGDSLVDIAKNLPSVDAVLGGHTHNILSTTVTTNSGKSIPVAVANYNGKGYIDLKVTLHEDGSLSFANANAAYVAQDTTSTVYPYGYKATTATVDLNVKQIITDTMTEEGPILSEMLGSAQQNMTRTQITSPYGESLAGNWATDVMRSESKADFAFQNNGGLRCDLPQGQINMSLIYQFMPFDNVIMTCDMTGAQLKVVLEEAVAEGGKGIQLSGLNFSYDNSKPSGSRVHSITKSEGTLVNLNDTTTTYKVATNDFLAGGSTAIPKDGFSFASQSSNMTDTHILVRDALAKAIRDAGTTGITASIESRIKNQPVIATPAVKIAVISDPHYFAPELGTTGSAFEQYLAGDRKMIAESKDILESTIAALKDSPAEIVLVSGDLTKDGELLSHQQFAGYLQELEDAGKKVYVIDGNHDINNPKAESYSGNQTTPVAYIAPSDFKTIYQNFGYAEAVAVDPNSLSYVVDPIPGLRIIAMDSVLYDTNIEDNYPKTAGAFSADRQAWINAQIADGVAKGKTVIGMMHHGVTNHFSLESGLFPEYVINNADQVASDLSNNGMKVVFTGHFHAQDIAKKTMPSNQFLFDVETGSLVTSPVPYRLVELTTDGKLNINTNRITDIKYNLGGKDFQTYAEDYLVLGLNDLVPQMLAGIIMQMQPGITQAQAMEAANNAAAQQLTSTLTVKDCLVNAMLAHYQGDEVIDSQLLPVYQGMAASSDALTQTLGGALLSLGTDLLPADNKITINLNSGNVENAHEFTVSIGSLTGGSITASPISAPSGAVINLTIKPDAGMRLQVGSLKYQDGTQAYAINGTSFTMPTANVVVSAVFEAISNGGGGSSGGGSGGGSSGGGSSTPSSTSTTITGTITDPTTAKPLGEANLSLYYALTDRNNKAGKTPDTLVALSPSVENPKASDASGTYSFKLSPTTDYYIVAKKEGYQVYKSPTISVEKDPVKWNFKMNQSTKEITRLSGLTRVDTALEIAKADYTTKLSNVVLATAENYPDALAGSVLAYQLKAPILLVGSTEADQLKILDYLKSNLDASGTVYILGGTAVVSAEMEAKVSANGFNHITRLGGFDRYETSVKIAEQIGVKTGTPIVLVYGENYPDALAISSIAAGMQSPILLVQKDGISDTVKQEIAKIKPSKVYIIGGEGVISPTVVSQVAQIALLDKTNIVRIAGVDSYETSLAVAQYFNLTGQTICIATGNNFPDALAGSVYAANHKAPIILADGSLSDQVMKYLQTTTITGATLFGGEAVVSKEIELQLKELINFKK